MIEVVKLLVRESFNVIVMALDEMLMVLILKH